MTTKATYEEYMKYCDALGSKPFSHTKFTQRLKSKGYEIKERRMMGQKYKIYKLEQENK